MNINLQFIADKANVSKSLASRVLNNKYVRVSDEKRELIKKLAKKYNYQSNQIAASLRTQKTNMIALILPTLYFDFFGQLAHTIETKAREKGYNVLICNSEEDLAIERHYLNLYRNGAIDGIIISPSDNSTNLDLMEEMNTAGFPMVFVDRYLKQLDNSFVTTDSYAGAKALTEKLIEKGHEKIYFLSHTKSPNTSVQIDRYSGYCDSLKTKGFKQHRIWIPDEFEKAEKILLDILSKDKKPTAFVIVTSWDIKPLLHACNGLNLTIPNDIEIAAFDKFLIPYTSSLDMEVAKNVKEPLLLVDQNPQEMGERAINILINNIDSEDKKTEKCFLKPNILNG